MSNVADLLQNMEAPEELVAWSAGRSFDDAWDECEHAVHQVWLWGAVGLSLNHGVLAVHDAAHDVLPSVPEARSIVEHVLGLAAACVDRRATREQCEQAADEAEQAARDAKATFRDAMPEGYTPIVRASAWIARAAEGLMTARLRAEAARMQRAQQTASYLGAGVNILVENEPPIRLAAELVPDDAFHSELLYVVAALAEAMEAVVAARVAVGQSREQVDRALCRQLRAATDDM